MQPAQGLVTARARLPMSTPVPRAAQQAGRLGLALGQSVSCWDPLHASVAADSPMTPHSACFTASTLLGLYAAEVDLCR